MGFFDAIKKVLGFSDTSRSSLVSTSSKSVPSGNPIKQIENYLLYAEHLLEYTFRISSEFGPSLDKVIKNEVRVSVLETLIKKYNDYVVASYLGSIKKIRSNPGLTGLRFSKILPSETVEQSYFSLSMSKLNAALIGRRIDFDRIRVTMHEGLDRINSNCTNLLAECKNMRSNGVQAGEAQRIQNIGLQIKVNLMKHKREIATLEGDLSKVTSLNVLTKMQRLESAIINTSRLYVGFEASLSSAKLKHDLVVRTLSYLGESNKSFTRLAANVSAVKVQLRALKEKSDDEGTVLNEFSNLSDVFVSECRARDEKLTSLVDSLTFRQLAKVAA